MLLYFIELREMVGKKRISIGFALIKAPPFLLFIPKMEGNSVAIPASPGKAMATTPKILKLLFSP